MDANCGSRVSNNRPDTGLLFSTCSSELVVVNFSWAALKWQLLLLSDEAGQQG